MITLESRSNASIATARRIRNRSKHAARGAAKITVSSTVAPPPSRMTPAGQSVSRSNGSARVKPRRFRLRNLLRSTVLVGVGVVVGACSIWHPHAVAGGTEGHYAVAASEQTKVSTSTTFRGKVAAPPHPTGLWTTVQPGDTIWSLADRFGNPDQPIRDTVQDILRWNHLHEDASLQVGQSIQVCP